MTDSIVQDEPCGAERSTDRYWFLLRGRRWRAGETGSGEDTGGTTVIRDGECVVVSIEATALGWPEGTLLFRFRSATTPCTGCVDRALALAGHRNDGRFTPNDVREMLRFAVARCVAAGIDVSHTHAPAVARMAVPPPLEGRGDAPFAAHRGAPAKAHGDGRYDAELWLIL
jgi:hypothetical protein